MWLYVQTWLPLLTISLTAAICFSVAAFIMAQPKLRVARFRSKGGQYLAMN
jgi:hypothetical protein